MSHDRPDHSGEDLRRRGLETMSKVYGWDLEDGPGDFFRYTADHLFADIWNRPGLSIRDRRLLLIGILAGTQSIDVLGIQIPAAHTNDELDDEALREIVIFVSHYAGWPMGARMHTLTEKTIGKAHREARRQAEAQAQGQTDAQHEPEATQNSGATHNPGATP